MCRWTRLFLDALSLTRDYSLIDIKATEEFRKWLKRLKDVDGRSRIQARIDRLANGNPGQNKVLKGGVTEFKINTGPGYRIYTTQRGNTLIILLCGGDKSTQAADIAKAQRMARDV